MGSTGDSPVPVGDPPTGTSQAGPSIRPSALAGDARPIPSGESPDGTGQWPVLLYEAHETLARHLSGPERAEYWKQEGIWKEVKAAFDKYFRAIGSPGASDRSRLLNAAYRTGQWAEFRSLRSEMKDIDYTAFEGKERFDKIVAYVDSQVTQTKNAR